MNLLEELHKVTLRSCASTKYQTGCLVVRPTARQQILANGWSHRSNGALNRLYSVHAEIHALSRLAKEQREKFVYDVYVMTVRRHKDTVVNSCPCYNCIIALKLSGARHVYFTTSDDNDLNYIDLTTDSLDVEFKEYRAEPCR